MNRKNLLLLLALIVIILPSCKKINGKGDVVSETRNVTGYTGIELAISGDVYYTPDTVYRLEILAQQNIIDVIETYRDGNTLIIKLKNHTVLGRHDNIRFNITAPHTTAFNISGSGTFHVGNVVEEPKLDFDISGSGSMQANTLYTGNLDANISGSGDVSAGGGTADYGYLKISGSGNINLINVVFDTVYATISGSGDIKVNVVKLLDGTISGSGNIRYDGNPVINSHISGSGSITHI